MSTIDGSIWSRCSIALICPTRSHFQRTLSRERWGQGLDERYRSSRKRRLRRRRRARKRQQKKENRQPILKKLCATLLRSFRGQHSKKTKGSARVNWYPQEDQQSFRPNLNGVGDRTTTLRRLLIPRKGLGNNNSSMHLSAMV